MLVPKIQGDAIELHPALVMFAIVIGGALAGLLGAILALPVAAAAPRRRTATCSGGSSPDAPEAARGVDRRARARDAIRGIPGAVDRVTRCRPPTRTRSSRSTLRPRTRSSRPRTGGSRASTTPTSAAGPDAAARMAAINAAWELDRRARAAGSVRSRAGHRDGAAAGRRSARRPRRRARRRDRPWIGATASATAREPVSRDWSSGRSSTGGGYDASMRTADGAGAAGPPPGNPSGSVLTFGRYVGLVARGDRAKGPRIHRVARPHADRPAVSRRDRRDPAAAGRRRSADADDTERRGLFRRR